MREPGAASTAVDRHDDPLEGFSKILADNLSGRRVIERAEHGIETEPATLAQLAAMQRVQAALTRLRARGDAVAGAADRASGLVVAALVDELARNTSRHVATWPGAERTLEALEHLLAALDEAVPAALAADQTSAANAAS